MSFVYLDEGTPLARKGQLPLVLPKIDLPVAVIQWELFVPDRYSAEAAGGNVIPQRHFSAVITDKSLGMVSPSAAPSGVAESITVEGRAQTEAAFEVTQPSANVLNLQQRASGVLPIRVDVPRAGVSHRFVKPLVIDQETTVTLRYKRR